MPGAHAARGHRVEDAVAVEIGEDDVIAAEVPIDRKGRSKGAVSVARVNGDSKLTANQKIYISVTRDIAYGETAGIHLSRHAWRRIEGSIAFSKQDAGQVLARKHGEIRNPIIVQVTGSNEGIATVLHDGR